MEGGVKERINTNAKSGVAIIIGEETGQVLPILCHAHTTGQVCVFQKLVCIIFRDGNRYTSGKFYGG